jgi:hypothetical protein
MMRLPRSLHALTTPNGLPVARRETETCLVLTSRPRKIGRKRVGASRRRLMLSMGMETGTQTEQRMPRGGIGTGRKGAEDEAETREDELSAPCVGREESGERTSEGRRRRWVSAG